MKINSSYTGFVIMRKNGDDVLAKTNNGKNIWIPIARSSNYEICIFENIKEAQKSNEYNSNWTSQIRRVKIYFDCSEM